MKRLKELYLICAFMTGSSLGWASSIVGGTEILPPGIRAFHYQYRGYNIDGEYTGSGDMQSFDVVTKLTISDLISAEQRFDKILGGLSDEEKAELQRVELSTIEIRPDVKVDAHVLGLGWGITKNLMVGFGIPIISAEVKLRDQIHMERKALDRAAAAIRVKAATSPEDKRAQLEALAGVLSSLPELEGQRVQNYLVNELGYKPLGHWRAQDFGDARLFAHINFVDVEREGPRWLASYRQGARLGAILPTGRQDDPDLLTDFAFGDGAFGVYGESRHDVGLFDGKVMVSVVLAYEHMLPSERDVRLPIGDTTLSPLKGTADFQRGDVFEHKLGLGVFPVKPFMIYYQQEWRRKERDAFADLGDAAMESALAWGTRQRSRVQEFGLSYSTADRFLRKGKFIPMNASLFYSQFLEGENIEQQDYASLEVQFFF